MSRRQFARLCYINYDLNMFDIQQTPDFQHWLTRLRDKRAVWLIASRLDRLRFGHFGDSQFVGAGVHELRIHYGPGYRIYFQQQGKQVILLLCGGDKGSQQNDIAKAHALARAYAAPRESEEPKESKP